MPLPEPPVIVVAHYTTGKAVPGIEADSPLVRECVQEFHAYMKDLRENGWTWASATWAQKEAVLDHAIDLTHDYFGDYDHNWDKEDRTGKTEIIGAPNGLGKGHFICRHFAAMTHYLLQQEGIASELEAGYYPGQGFSKDSLTHGWVKVDNAFLLETSVRNGTQTITNRATKGGMEAEQVLSGRIYIAFLNLAQDSDPGLVRYLYHQLGVSPPVNHNKSHPKVSYTLAPFGNHLFVRANNIPWQPAVSTEQKARV